MMETKVLWMTNIPSPYRIDFFEELGKNLDLTVIFEKDVSDERDASWKQSQFANFNGIILSGKSVRTDSAFDFKIKYYLKSAKEYSHIVISNPLTPLGMYSISYLSRHHIRFFIESDGGFAKTGRGPKEILKKYFIRRASGWLSTADIHDQYYLTYGAVKSAIYRYPFTSVKEKDILRSPYCMEQKRELKTALGIKESKMVLAVGQFIDRKGFDLLLEIADRFPDSAIVLLGGGETETYREIRERKNLQNVYYPGFIHREKISEYYHAADVFVLPTREDIWGLVINEAMAYGLPVITTERCIAGTALVNDGENGYLIPVNDTEQLYDRLQLLLEDDALRMKMAISNLEKIQEYTIEKMARWHDEFFAQH